MSKNLCKSKNAKGENCKAFADASGFCFMHNAEKGKERALARRNGGLATKKPHFADASVLPVKIRSVENVLTVLDYALIETIGLDNSIQRGRLLVAISHGFIEALKVGEFEKRLEAIEHALNLRKPEK